MEKAKIIFLNGVTSSGKTSISKAIQEIADDDFYHLSNDMFHDLEAEIINKKYLNYGDLVEGDIYMAESIIIMYHTVKVLAEQGTNVIVDGMLFETNGFIKKYNKTNYDSMQSILDGFDVFMVEVFCPLDECRRRNIARGDRGENQSHEQNEIMNKKIKYDFSVDTSIHSVEECANKIISEVKATR